jgi:hypothetical protein
MGNIIILTKTAQQVAVREKDGSGPVLSYQRCLFSEMGIVGSDFRLFSCFANPNVAAGSIDIAATGTKSAVAKLI